MGYLIKATVGLALFIGGIVLFNVKLVSLLETGTCASQSNNPKLVISPCPSGTGTDILLLMASIFGGLIGAGIFAFRGDPPWAKGHRSLTSAFSWGTFAWGLFFASTGATALIASLTDEAVKGSQGGQLGGLIVGGVFLVMGVPAILIAIWGLIKGRGHRDERPATSAGPLGAGGTVSQMISGLQRSALARRGTPSGSGNWPWGSGGVPGGGGGGGPSDQIGKLERLQKLHESGALSKSEFEREKAKILADG
jgi:hypothetical protein